MTLPEYFHLVKDNDKKAQWVVVQPKDVPVETGLAEVSFSRPLEDPSKPYVTPDDAESCWKKPGPVAGPFQAHPGHGSVGDKRPFYLQISHYAVHVTMQTRRASLEKYERLPKGEKHNVPAFGGMTEDLDVGVGKILDKIDELGIAGSTYVIYMADNGAAGWIPPSTKRNLSNPTTYKIPSRNHPLRGGKWVTFDLRAGFACRLSCAARA